MPLALFVSADSRYLLYLNGELIGRGPAKGDVRHQFYETYEIGPRLKSGRNVIAALVIDMSRVAHRPTHLGAPCSVITYAGGFLLEGELEHPGLTPGERLDTGLPGWRVSVDRDHRFQNDGTRFEGYHGYFEHRVDGPDSGCWTDSEYDDASWNEATVLYKAERFENRRDPTSPYGMVPRMVPPQEEGSAERFRDVFREGGEAAGNCWSQVTMGGSEAQVPPKSTVELIFDVGELTTGYPRLEILGGAGSLIRLTYAEALRLPWGTPGARLLGRRQSLENLASHFADEDNGWTFDRRGRVTGWSDLWQPLGRGTDGRPEVFEPLHWRAYRYIGLRIGAGDAPLIVRSFTQRFTAYPFEKNGSFRCSDERLNRIWALGLRTMRLCSHETYEDCPHYEQMQYAGDTMITSRIALLTSGDHRLTRQALYHFDWSRISDGLTQSRYPSRLLQVIPSWSLHWITVVRDYVYHTGDLAVAADLLPGICAVLDWFRRHGDRDGLPGKLPYWNITDWCPWWPRGVVPGADTGPTAIIAAQYICGLDEAADLACLIGRDEVKRDLAHEAAALREVYVKTFWSEAEGLFYDRPGGPELSQYGNAWAIVSGAANADHRRRMLERFPTDVSLAPGSFFCWHAVFRALALSGAYHRMPEFLGPWHEMVSQGLSTFVEENSYWRSLCHAWSAHPLIDFLTMLLGVTPKAPGFSEIRIAPHLCGLSEAAGSVCTPRGNVTVKWIHREGRLILEADAPRNTPVTIVLPDGATHKYQGGNYRCECAMP